MEPLVMDSIAKGHAILEDTTAIEFILGLFVIIVVMLLASKFNKGD